MAINRIHEKRAKKLRQILDQQRTIVLQRVRELRDEQEQDVATSPADELDVAPWPTSKPTPASSNRASFESRL
jgi:hypothetical protein